MQFVQGRKEIVLSGILLVMGIAFYITPTSERVFESKPLNQLPQNLSGWESISESKPDKEILELLKADDTLTRVYRNPAGPTASLFIAFFKSQRAGVSPHSPKVCLPGAGWLPEQSGRVALTVPSMPGPITVNRYIVSRGEQRSVVLYWYQSPHRVIADEFAAKFWMVVDGVHYRRSDTSLVRVIVPVGTGGEQAAYQQAQEFVQSSFPFIKAHLPS
jgi:EpsI family protein